MHNYPDVFALTDAQFDEMEKIALGAGWGRAIGALGGAALGAGAGYATGETPEDKKRRALGGAVLGGIGGLLPGQFLTAQGRRQATRFGQRQLHGFTGYLPGKGLLGRGPEGTKFYQLGAKGGEVTKAERLSKLREMRMNVPEKKSLTELVSEKRGPLKEFRAKRQLAAQEAQRQLAEENLTNIPGLARGYLAGTKNLSRAGVLKANLAAPGLALGVGAPVAFAAPSLVEAARERDPRKAARTVAETAGYMVGGGLPLAAAAVTGSGISNLAGRVIGSRPQPVPGRVVPQGGVQ